MIQTKIHSMKKEVPQKCKGLKRTSDEKRDTKNATGSKRPLMKKEALKKMQGVPKDLR
jgi:hypothetical protein